MFLQTFLNFFHLQNKKEDIESVSTVFGLVIKVNRVQKTLGSNKFFSEYLVLQKKQNEGEGE